MKTLKRTIIFFTVVILLCIALLLQGIFLMNKKYDLSKYELPYWHTSLNYTTTVEKSEIMRNVVVAIVDTGTDETDFPYENIVHGYNVVENDNNTKDRHGHGKVLSHIVASPKIGINKYATILPVKARKSMIDNPEKVSIGIEWAVDNGADIINLSIGREATSNKKHLGYVKGVEYALSKEVLVVASSGTSGDSVFYPGAIDGVVTVGGINSDHEYTSKINLEEIDIFAVDTKENVSSSFPTAMVSGAVSLAMSLDENISSHGAMEIVLKTADRETINGVVVKILNIDKVVDYIRKQVNKLP